MRTEIRSLGREATVIVFGRRFKPLPRLIGDTEPPLGSAQLALRQPFLFLRLREAVGTWRSDDTDGYTTTRYR